MLRSEISRRPFPGRPAHGAHANENVVHCAVRGSVERSGYVPLATAMSTRSPTTGAEDREGPPAHSDLWDEAQIVVEGVAESRIGVDGYVAAPARCN
jgi:hypothetical protein